MKNILLFTFICISFVAKSQNKGLNYQAVILDPKPLEIPGETITGQPLINEKICVKFSIYSSSNRLEYEEIQETITDNFGLINLTIGNATASGNNSSIYKSFNQIVWDTQVKDLKVSVSFSGCTNFIQVSKQTLNYTPYALYAESVDYKNVRDSPTKLSQFSNDAGYLIPKDLDPLKADVKNNTADIKTNAADIAEANKNIAANKKSSDEAFLITNQSIKSLDVKVAENTSSISNINSKLTDQQSQINENRNKINTTVNYLDNQVSSLQSQINTTNSIVNNLSGAAEVISSKSTAIDLGGSNPSDQLYPSQKATKTYVDQNISSLVAGNIPDATTLAPGKIQLAGDLGGTATNPTVPALANKENTSNKSTNIQGDAGSDSKYPSVKAVKTYVDQATMGTALQATVDGKADKNSPTFTGTPVLPTGTTGVTQSAADNSTKLATTAFVQAATAGIALQAAVDAKADKNSPTFTGTPVLPTGTTGVTQSAADNSTKLATTAFVQQATAAGVIDASTSAKGKLKLAGDLGGTAELPTVPGLALKAPIESPTFTGTIAGISKSMVGLSNVENTSDADKPISSATATALSAKAIASEVTSSLALKAPLDSPTFTGTPSLPTGTTASTQTSTDNSTKLATTAFVQLATAAGVIDASTSLKGKLKLAGDLAGTADLPTVPGLALKANTSDITISLALKEDAANKSTATDLGSTGSSDILFPSQKAVKTYVDTQVATKSIVDADAVTKGKIQLAGDLSGTAASPAIATGVITSAKIADGEIVNADISTTAAIADTKLATITTAGKVSNSATTATTFNTASAIVARDPNGSFMAGNITASLSGNATTATKLAASKKINGTAFDGSSDITVTAAAGTLSGTSLNSTVVSSSLTSVGTLTNLTVTNPITGSITGNAETATSATSFSGNLTGDVTGTQSATVVGKLNGTSLAGLSTGLLKNTTSTGIPSIAISGTDFAPGTSTLTTGILKSTTTTGTLSIASASDFPTLNQNTTGNALTATSATYSTNLAGGSAGSIPYQTASGTTSMLGESATNGYILTYDTGLNAPKWAAASSAGVTSIGSINAGSNPNGASISLSGVLTLNAADANNGGVITSSTQAFGGDKTFNGKVIVGASSEASSSAVLEASSTTQGFLPPRMSGAQRDAISSKVAGLVVWCSNCGSNGELQVYNGTTWTNMIGGTAARPLLVIGEAYQGGKVAYILVSGDPGYDANTQHGLIAATSDQSTGIGIRWYNGSNTITGATGTAIGTGLSNTNTIIASQGGTATSYAAGLARSYRGGGYDDWYLPSKNELNKLYINRTAIGGFASGGLEGDFYWSSSEFSISEAWDQEFNVGSQGYGIKSYPTYVRAIRSF